MEFGTYTSIIEHNGKYYFFNSLYGSLDQIGTKRPDIRDDERWNDTELEYLRKRGHLQEKNSQKQEYNDLKKEYLQKTESADSYIIPLTRSCNLSCKYCFQKNQEQLNDITFENLRIIKKCILELAKKRAKKVQEVVLYGGEPLLEKNKKYVRDILEFCQENGFLVRIITNGTNIDKYLLLIEKYRNIVKCFTITIDGPKRIHDRNRVYTNGKGSFTRIIENTQILDRLRISYEIRMNLNDELYDYIDKKNYDLGGNNLAIHQVLNDGKPDDKCRYANILKLVYDGKIDIKNVAENCILQFYFLMKNHGAIYPLYSYCNEGNTFLFSLDGINIYNCNESENNIVKYGEYTENGVLISNLNDCYIEECECEYKPICGGGCRINRSTNNPNECIYHAEITEMIKLYIDLKEGEQKCGI